MSEITVQAKRYIVDDFSREIRDRAIDTAKPSKTVINFRTDRADGNERTVWRVPIEILRYRKDNGRIASDILDYEANVGPLDEKDQEAQTLIAQFLREKDPQKTATLRQSILHDGQQEPAIITCDGFLINGNRRKMVMETLHAQHPHEDNFAYMKVVILPGEGDTGGPPTLFEIEQLENRYQLQSDGKSDLGFRPALCPIRKIEWVSLSRRSFATTLNMRVPHTQNSRKLLRIARKNSFCHWSALTGILGNFNAKVSIEQFPQVGQIPKDDGRP